jgi:uncharacterized protein
MSEKAAEAAMEMPQHGEFCWTEIMTDDLEKCRSFYENVFGWHFKKSTATGEDHIYLEFGADAQRQFGGMSAINPEWYQGETPPPHYNIYVSVEDVDETASKAFDLGGKIVGPPMDVPNVGRMCQIEDPTGAKFFVITLKS